MAQCHRSLGETDTALEMFRQFLKAPAEQTTPSARDIANKAIKELASAPGAQSVTSVGISNAIFEPRVRDADCLITPIP
jgi:hypothetical protein